jgi:hypothetical protein
MSFMTSHVNKGRLLSGEKSGPSGDRGGMRMKDFPMSKKAGRTGRMGRPPLNVKRTIIRLSPDIIARIEAIAGKRRMSEFIRQTVEAELLRREAGADAKPKPVKPTKPTKVRK